MSSIYKSIEVQHYNPEWVHQFEREAKLIKQVLGENCIAIHHIGSTSIPGLIAKPDIDILCVVNKLTNSLPLQDQGYLYKGELNIPLRYYFSKNTELSKVNLHVVEPNHSFINLNLCFRDYLRGHEKEKLAYSSLKEELLKDPKSYLKTESKFTGYNLGKDKFIKSILKMAGFHDFSLNFCMHHDEWEAFHKIKNHFLKKSNDHDHQETIANQYYFVLYKGIDIVCIAQLELNKNKLFVLVLTSGPSFQALGYEDTMLNLLNKWAQNKEYEFSN